MKSQPDLDEPRIYFERNVLFVGAMAVLSAVLVWLSIDMLKNINPWGTLVGVPAIVLTFQTLWLITNPYAIVYEDRFEIKHSFFYGKTVYFLDLKQQAISRSKLVVTYNDGDQERLPLSGIRGSHKATLEKALGEKLEKNKETRNF